MDIGTIMSLWTVIVMAIFILIVIWAWSGSRKQSFDEASRIPLENDEKVTAPDLNTKETDHV